jgi:hypothetical protein
VLRGGRRGGGRLVLRRGWVLKRREGEEVGRELVLVSERRLGMRRGVLVVWRVLWNEIWVRS